MRAYHEHSEQVINICLLPAEFEVCMVYYRPSVFQLIYSAGHKTTGKNEDP